MITLFIMVGVFAIECRGSSCFSIDSSALTYLISIGGAELIFEIKNVVKIFRKRERDEH
jgi:hypothetical protein